MIDTRIVDGIAVVTMTHGKANALTIAFCDAIAACFNEIKSSAARAVVLTGQGKIFSAGVDLPHMLDGGPPYVRDFLPALHRLYEAVFFHPKPVVAAINGHAIAGGCVLACCADRKIMAQGGGRIGVTELKVGVPFPPLAFEVMRYTTEPKYLTEAIVGAGTYLPEEGLLRGFVDEIVAPEMVMDRALAVAKAYAALSPAAFAQSKAQIRAIVRERVAQAARDDKSIADIWANPSTLQYMRDYVAATLKK
jgi:enoyl-CoA hydratase